MDKGTYRVQNWNHYNKSLINRGKINFWINGETENIWQEKSYAGFGRPKFFSDTAIVIALTLRELFKLPLRSTQGLLESLKELINIDIKIPNYTTLSKRQKTLKIEIPKMRSTSETLNIAIDSTGLKIYGEGEWKIKMHGKTKRRTWRKLHIAIDLSNHSIVSAQLTTADVHDAQVLESLLPEGADIMVADGIYDTFKVYEQSVNNQSVPIIPPRSTAAISSKKELHYQERNNVVKAVNRLGLKLWKQLSGYHQRSLVETAMFRLKKFFGPSLKNRNFKHQEVESYLRCSLINHFANLGMPKSIKI